MTFGRDMYLNACSRRKTGAVARLGNNGVRFGRPRLDALLTRFTKQKPVKIDLPKGFI